MNNENKHCLDPQWKWKSLGLLSDTLRPHGLYSPWNSPGQNTGAFSFSRGSSQYRDWTQVSRISRRQILYQVSNQGSPRILEWVAYPFSSRSSWPRNQTEVSCIAGGFLTNWAIRDWSTACSSICNIFLDTQMRFPLLTHSSWILFKQKALMLQTEKYLLLLPTLFMKV